MRLKDIMDMVAAGDRSQDTVLRHVEALRSFCSQLLKTDGVVGDSSCIQDKCKWLWTTSIGLYLATNTPCVLLNYNYALFLISLGDPVAAVRILSACLDTDPHFAVARESLESAKSLVVERWHFRMLNDRPRNSAFKRAIETALRGRSDATVLDIGGGTALLSMFAVAAGARHVYCCEMSAALCSVARECVRAAGLEQRITVLQKHSSRLILDEDLPAVDLVVAELVDAGLLGEHIVEVLGDAKRLLRPGGSTIPHSATVYGCLISSAAVAAMARFEDAAAGGLLCAGPEEEYTCEALEHMSHTRLSAPCELVRIDFRLLHEERLMTQALSFPATSAGRVDGVAYWFRLYLLGPDPDPDSASHTAVFITVETCPGRAQCSWDQCIVFQQRPVRVVCGQTVSMEVRAVPDRTSFRFLGTGHCGPPAAPLPLLRLSEVDMVIMNDTVTRELVVEALNSLCLENEEEVAAVYEDCGADWDSVALRCARLRQRWVRKLVGSEDAGRHLASLARSLDAHNFAGVAAPLLEHLQAEAVPGGRDGGCGLVVLVTDVLERSGLFRQPALRDAGLLSALFPGRVCVVPCAFAVRFVLLESDPARQQHVVLSENTLGVDLSALNQFSSQRLCGLELGNAAQYKRLSDIAGAPEEVSLGALPVEVAAGSTAGCPLVLHSQVSVPVISPGRLDLVGFWIEARLTQDSALTLDTGPRGGAAWQQAALLLPAPHRVLSPGQSVRLDVRVSLAYGFDCAVISVD